MKKKLEPLREKVEDIHRRLVYKVPGEREHPSKLEQKLREKDNLYPETDDL